MLLYKETQDLKAPMYLVSVLVLFFAAFQRIDGPWRSLECASELIPWIFNN